MSSLTDQGKVLSLKGTDQYGDRVYVDEESFTPQNLPATVSSRPGGGASTGHRSGPSGGGGLRRASADTYSSGVAQGSPGTGGARQVRTSRGENVRTSAPPYLRAGLGQPPPYMTAGSARGPRGSTSWGGTRAWGDRKSRPLQDNNDDIEEGRLVVMDAKPDKTSEGCNMAKAAACGVGVGGVGGLVGGVMIAHPVAGLAIGAIVGATTNLSYYGLTACTSRNS